MSDASTSALIYDWNTAGRDYPHRTVPVQLNDETLRDGLQSPSVQDPPIETKLRLLHLMDRLGIHTADLGLPGAGARACADITALVREIGSAKLGITPNVAVRTVETDILAASEIAQATGQVLEICAFIGSSPIRQYAENWTIDRMLRLTEDAVALGVKHGLKVTYVTEDTTRARPEDVRRLNRAAIEAGARRLCICDTVGHITPQGVENLVAFMRQLVKESGEDVKLDWHGHNDRGLAVVNTITAMMAGVDRVHATALGVGERVGNCSMDQLMVNLKLMGYIDNDITPLAEYVRVASEGTAVPVPVNYPVFGEDAFRTATGVHAAAIIKAQKKETGVDSWLADRVYSGVPARMVGKRQVIEVGFMSGASNVSCWLREHGYEASDALVKEILQVAKDRNCVLRDDDLHGICRAHTTVPASA